MMQSKRVGPPAVLFVDRDEVSRFAYHALGTSWGFRVELARDTREAFTLANVFLPDVIVVDVNIRDAETFRALMRLRGSARTQMISVLTVSSDDSAILRAAVRASRADAHLTKPFASDALARLVAALAANSRAKGSARAE